MLFTAMDSQLFDKFLCSSCQIFDVSPRVFYCRFFIFFSVKKDNKAVPTVTLVRVILLSKVIFPGTFPFLGTFPKIESDIQHTLWNSTLLLFDKSESQIVHFMILSRYQGFQLRHIARHNARSF